MITMRGEPSRLGVTSDVSTDHLCLAVGRNTGNLAFSYATAQILGFPKQRGYSEPAEKDETVAVYALANNIGKHFDPTRLSDFVAAQPAEWKVLAIGLGAQGPLDRLKADPKEVDMQAAHVEWLNRMIDRSPANYPSIGVRGDFTLAVLERFGLHKNAIVTGCPSLFISRSPNLGAELASKYRSIGTSPIIDTALGNPWDSAHARFEQSLISLSSLSGGTTHVQMGAQHVRLARGDALADADAAVLHRQLAPNVPSRDFLAFARKQLRVWWDVPSWMEALRRADFLIGSRIHGVALALQAGTPALCAAWDSRTRELCQTMCIPHVSVYEEPWSSGRFSWDDMRRAFESQFDPTAFDAARRSRAVQVVSFFAQHGLRVTDVLMRLAASPPSNTTAAS